MPGVADIVEHLSREIHEHAKDTAARTAVDEQKIVRPIVRKPVFSVVRLVGVVGHIMPAALDALVSCYKRTISESQWRKYVQFYAPDGSLRL